MRSLLVALVLAAGCAEEEKPNPTFTPTPIEFELPLSLRSRKTETPENPIRKLYKSSITTIDQYMDFNSVETNDEKLEEFLSAYRPEFQSRQFAKYFTAVYSVTASRLSAENLGIIYELMERNYQPVARATAKVHKVLGYYRSIEDEKRINNTDNFKSAADQLLCAKQEFWRDIKIKLLPNEQKQLDIHFSLFMYD